MKRFAIISYNMYTNFTNYGSALQSYALQTVVNGIDKSKFEAIILNYCPDVCKDYDALDPYKKMWDMDEESKHMVELTMPAIRENYIKFKEFFNRNYRLSKYKYTSDNFSDSYSQEELYGYICGSDAIWCVREMHGFDDGFFANYEVMKNSHTISYAASFQNKDFSEMEIETLKQKMQNFSAISVRESTYIDIIAENTHVPVCRCLDPTLLLSSEDYECITAERVIKEPYLLVYTRRYNADLEGFAERFAKDKGLRIVEISLRAINSEKGHIMRYDAGVEEFLSFVKYADYIITNSFHGAIFGLLFHKDFAVYTRELCDTKVYELMELLGLSNSIFEDGIVYNEIPHIDYTAVDIILSKERLQSVKYLEAALREGDPSE